MEKLFQIDLIYQDDEETWSLMEPPLAITMEYGPDEYYYGTPYRDSDVSEGNGFGNGDRNDTSGDGVGEGEHRHYW